MAKTNAERQHSYRERRKMRMAKLESELADTKRALREATDLIVRLQRSVDDDDTLDDKIWERLAGMTPAQLAVWVKVGQRMALKGHDSPAFNAAAWVEGNLIRGG